MRNLKGVLTGGLMLAALPALAACNEKSGGDSPATGETAERTAGYNEDRNAYFGDLHIHTKNSFDAYIFNVRSSPDDAYAFGKGGEVLHPSGYKIKLDGPPLDFMAVTDHAEYMGILGAMNDPENKLSKLPIAKQLYSADPDVILRAFGIIGGTVRSGKAREDIYDKDVIGGTWRDAVAAADRHYEPGKFTTFAAYEYTSTYAPEARGDSFAGGNLHRNVVFRGSAPDMPFSTLDSTNPEDLWDWMDGQRSEGNEVLSIPHNSNVSDSQMFKLETFEDAPLTKAYSDQRMRNEPIVEITQVKGTSETHPSLSPNDEWANFEIYEYLLASQQIGDTKFSYVRKALADGLQLQERLGFNPFQFGLIGSSDTHVSGGSFSEKGFWSKVGIVDGTAEARGSVPPGGKKSWEGVVLPENIRNWFSRWSAAGLAGVWAVENTREAIFDAMRRKETFATSGTRIKVRFFGGFGFDAAMLDDPALVSKAYKQGVPMGGDLIAKDDRAPSFIAWAMRDPDAAPLQRIQIVKLWTEGGETREKVIDIACSDGLKPENGRCGDNGASVDLKTCTLTGNKGAGEIRTVWTDPEYRKGQRASYYLRVLENPSCRWSTWDAIMAGVMPNPDLPPTLQERAWSSPIWLVPMASTS
ncbi:MAG: DUF3604 domain-containing protein [Blastomonas sp.]